MFGYVRPLKGEMKVREYEQYKAVYCTLCKALEKHYGLLAKFALSYDITFYAVLALDLSGCEISERKGRCAVNPAKKCNFICEGNEAYHKAAALTVLTTYYKLIDNIEDESFFKRLGAKLLKLVVNKAAKKAKNDFPYMDEALSKMTEEQRKVEESEDPSIDECAAPTADALKTIFPYLTADDTQKLVLGQFGYFFGRWIYFMDAADDLEDDLKSKSFNPFIERLSLSGKTALTKEEKDKADNYCNEVLNSNAAMINNAVNLLDLNKYENIITNVTVLGLGEVQREILFMHIHSKDRKGKKYE